MMFETYESDRIVLGSNFSAGSTHAWRQVKMGDFSPHFLVVVGAAEHYLPETWQLASAYDLIRRRVAVQQEFPNRSILTYLLSPPHMNKTTQWQIEALEEIWVSGNFAYSDQVFRYVLKSGCSYVHGVPEREASAMNDSTSWERLY